MAINKWIGIGNLCRDPETRQYDGNTFANITIACNERRKDKEDHVEYIRISFFGKLAEIAGQYLKKGSQVYIEGRLRTRKYTDKEGIDRYATEIIADTMQMLGSRQDEQQTSRPAQNTQRSQPQRSAGLSDMDDDIPF